MTRAHARAWRTIALTIGALALAACRDRDVEVAADESQSVHVREVIAAGGVVDSVLPIDEHLRRFRANLSERPDTLRHASSAIEALVHRWAAAVSQRDTVSLRRMSLDAAEFAWLYYPGSQLSKPPFESPPLLLWDRLQSSSESGARQVLTRFGGRRFDVLAVTCPPPNDTTSHSRVYSSCRVRVRLNTRTPIEDRLFGSIIEHDGRFKFLGYANRL